MFTKQKHQKKYSRRFPIFLLQFWKSFQSTMSEEIFDYTRPIALELSGNPHRSWYLLWIALLSNTFVDSGFVWGKVLCELFLADGNSLILNAFGMLEGMYVSHGYFIVTEHDTENTTRPTTSLYRLRVVPNLIQSHTVSPYVGIHYFRNINPSLLQRNKCLLWD